MPVHDDAPADQRQNYSNMGGKSESASCRPLAFCLLMLSFLGKGVFIGINYTGSSAALKGCHNDAENISEFMIGQCGLGLLDVSIDSLAE